MKAWEEEWSWGRGSLPEQWVLEWEGGHTHIESNTPDYDADHARAKLAAAAPAMARALCLVELAGLRLGPCGHEPCCAACATTHMYSSNGVLDEEPKHAKTCPLDAALTAAGLTPQDREAVRKGAR